MQTETNTTTTHILRTAGITITGRFDERTAAWSCEWSGPVTASRRRKALQDYRPWRDAIFAAFARRTGKRVAVLEIG